MHCILKAWQFITLCLLYKVTWLTVSFQIHIESLCIIEISKFAFICISILLNTEYLPTLAYVTIQYKYFYWRLTPRNIYCKAPNCSVTHRSRYLLTPFFTVQLPIYILRRRWINLPFTLELGAVFLTLHIQIGQSFNFHTLPGVLGYRMIKLRRLICRLELLNF